jgi:hypothetical protein
MLTDQNLKASFFNPADDDDDDPIYINTYSQSSNTQEVYTGVLISLCLFLLPISLFGAQPKEFFLNGLKKLEQQSHKCVELRGEYVE